MSTFCLREGEPYADEYCGDYATHPIYNNIQLMAQLNNTINITDSFYIAKTDNEEYVIINIKDCTDIGYYGD